jgi:transcription termination factor NusB
MKVWGFFVWIDLLFEVSYPIIKFELSLFTHSASLHTYRTLYFMANRHLSRSIVLQSLFERDFRSAPDNTIEEILHRHVDEFAPGMGDFSFVKNLADGVLKKRKDIDTIIEKAAPEWPIDKIAPNWSL